MAPLRRPPAALLARRKPGRYSVPCKTGLVEAKRRRAGPPLFLRFAVQTRLIRLPWLRMPPLPGRLYSPRRLPCSSARQSRAGRLGDYVAQPVSLFARHSPPQTRGLRPLVLPSGRTPRCSSTRTTSARSPPRPGAAVFKLPDRADAAVFKPADYVRSFPPPAGRRGVQARGLRPLAPPYVSLSCSSYENACG